MYPIYDFGGTGDILHLAVANGFPPQTYIPMVEPFLSRYHVVNLMPRALWEDEMPPKTFHSWKDLVAQDLRNGVVHYDWRNIVAIGHSFGGIATLLTAIQEPSRFRAVILLDPTILPRPYMRAIQLSRLLGRRASNGLAERAEKRKDVFDNPDAAYQYLRDKKLFADWHEDAFRGYIQSLKPLADGTVTLAWKREWEAYYFRTLYAGTWGDLPKLRAKMPLLLIRGATSDTLIEPVAKQICRILPDVTYHEIPGHGHLFPQSAPHQTADIIQKWLETIQ